MSQAPTTSGQVPAKTSASPSRSGIGGQLGAGAESNPLALVAGGLAVGAAIGALVPRSARERRLLAPVGERIGTGITAAIGAAKQAGATELDAEGISIDAARDQVRHLVDGLFKAASVAGAAAMQAVTGKAPA